MLSAETLTDVRHVSVVWAARLRVDAVFTQECLSREIVADDLRPPAVSATAPSRNVGHGRRHRGRQHYKSRRTNSQSADRMMYVDIVLYS